MFSRRWLFSWVAITPLLNLPAGAQSVVSTRSGLINFVDGSVFLNDERVEQKFGKFDQMKDGSELWTQDGKAEVMLTPGVFVRVGPNSAIRMVSTLLTDTRVEVFKGASIVEVTGTASKAPVTILYKDYQARISKEGRYRFNCEPPELRVESGQAEISYMGKEKIIETGYLLPFLDGVTAWRFDTHVPDALEDWNNARNESISAENADAGKSSDLSTAINNWQNDPDAALLAAQGMSAYVPPVPYGALPSYPLSPTYTPPLTAYNPMLVSPGLGVLPYMGMTALIPFGMYPLSIYGYYPYLGLRGAGYLGSSIYGRGLGIGQPIGIRPIRPYTGAGAARTGIGAGRPVVGHIGGRR